MPKKLDVGAEIMKLHNEDLQSKILEHRLDEMHQPYNLVRYRGEGGPSTSTASRRDIDVNQLMRKLSECETKVSRLATMLDETFTMMEKSKTGAKTLKKKKKTKKKKKKHKKH